MAQALVKYFLSLNILLLSGYSQLTASVYKENMPVNDHKGSKHFSFGTLQSDQKFVDNSSSPSSGNEEGSSKIIATEKEEEQDEDKLISLENHLTNGSFFTSVFCFGAFGCSFDPTKKIFSFYKHFTYNSPCSYIIFRVFRV